MIVLDNLEKVYETRAGKTWVLRRISQEIRAGELVTVMGPSGAGKSTLLAIVGKKDLFPSQLSGGQQQLVAVARAVIGAPRVILADEPVGSLHTDHGRMIMELLARLNGEGTTIV